MGYMREKDITTAKVAKEVLHKVLSHLKDVYKIIWKRFKVGFKSEETRGFLLLQNKYSISLS